KPKETTPLSINDWIQMLIAILPAVFLIMLVLGSIFFGIATPTESSAMGALGAGLLAFINKRLDIPNFRKSLEGTLRTMGFLTAIFIGATCFSLVLRRLGGDEMIANSIINLGVGNYGTVLFVLLIIFVLGFFLEWIEITMIMLPIVAPIINQMDLAWIAESGMDASSKPALIWFAILCAVALQTSFLTPPVGFALFYIKGVAPPEISLKHIYRGVVPFIIIQLIALGLVVAFPQLVTWLPGVSY
ncbi:MAG: TRAP transporter large permease subunit, partial [Opitutales bacterium]|nr:TRAP transporter large permease subunit [Opitutales bacterium]